MLSASAEGRVTEWSPAAERLLQYAAGDVMGQAFASLGQDPPALDHALDRALQSDSVHTVCLTAHLSTKTGEQAATFVCVDALRDEEGRVEGFFISLRELRAVVMEPAHQGARGRLAVPDSSALKALTPRQQLVLELIARGHSTREIAKRLNRSVKTVETHRAQLMKRLKVYHVPGLVGFAIRAGLVSVE